MRESQIKSLLLCVLAFVVGLLVVVSIGCSVSSQTEIKALPTPIHLTYPQDLTYPVTGYDLDKVVGLEIECCEDCGFVPWTDSWCEFHFAT